MKRRNHRRRPNGRNKNRKNPKKDELLGSEVPPFLVKGDPSMLAKPEVRLALGMTQLLCNFAVDKLFSMIPPEERAKSAKMSQAQARDHLKAIQARINGDLKKHPEAEEPIKTKINERQEGRSEVIRAIAKPKQS